MRVDMLHGILGFDHFPTKEDIFPFGVVAKRSYHQTTGPPPRRSSQLMRLDRLQDLLELGAGALLLRKTNLPSFRCGCKEAPSPDDGPTAKHI
jgi:hypothetical protein